MATDEISPIDIPSIPKPWAELGNFERHAGLLLAARWIAGCRFAVRKREVIFDMCRTTGDGKISPTDSPKNDETQRRCQDWKRRLEIPYGCHDNEAAPGRERHSGNL